ncbi:hypothetical protein J437_LFUL009440 [Ladona fulva]|uniref:DDE-1 domain-containing protein n=1 Tax=Ladona fulva TaxID=123851 RepID=A0A8K0NWU3_LADFU|nr:hypothetical protein J437_LFUL009440 [Ladona fulva]
MTQDRLVQLMLTESRSSLQVKILPVGQEFASPSGQEFACKLLTRNLLSIPPHSSHKMQPLDKVFFKLLKDYLSQMSDNWLLNHPGRVMTNYQIAEIFGQAHERTATMGKGIKGFELCGIFPVKRNVFSDDDFLPSSVTDQPMPVHHRAHLMITPVRERNVKKWTSPADVIPLPKRQEAQKRKINKQKSEILTSSPFKDKLIAAEEKKAC